MNSEDMQDYRYNEEPWYTQSEMDEIKSLVRDFFEILDRTEVNSEGVGFKPTKITSCRALDAQSLSKVLREMKQFIEE